MIKATIYKDTDTPTSLGLLASAAEVNITTLTRVTLVLGDLVLDSGIHSGVFDWATNGATGQLDIVAGHVNGLERGVYKARLTVFDATYPNGLVWGFIMVTVT